MANYRMSELKPVNQYQTMKITKTIAAFVSLLLVVLTGSTQQHYPVGAEGIKNASLPPPGIYLRDYNILYVANDFPDGPPGFDALAYINAPRLIWITDKKFLGADYGMDLIVPFGYADVSAAGDSDHRFGIADIQFEPLLLSWHQKQFDFAFGYAVWAPTGEFDQDHLANLGSGFWSHMLTAGATWHLDSEKTWAIGILNRYEFHHEQKDTDVTPGQTFTMEWAVSKTVCQGVDLGVVGYWQQQTTKASGAGASSELASVAAVGPEISAVLPKLGVIASLRYLREFCANARPEGNTISLTLTKRF